MQRKAFRVSGFIMVVVACWLLSAAMVAVIAANVGAPDARRRRGRRPPCGGTLLLVLIATGFIVISPNDARVIQFFGQYVGTIGEPGSTGPGR